MCKITVSTFEFLGRFPDEKSAREYYENCCWHDGVVCPLCSGGNNSPRKGRIGFYHCNDCRRSFSAKSGTIMERSKIEIWTWLYTMYLLSTARKGISSLQLSKEIGVTQKTAWFMLHRIREACDNCGGLLKGQIDETYIGGREKNRHFGKRLKLGRSSVGKAGVLGIKERGGRVLAMPLSGEADSICAIDRAMNQSIHAHFDAMVCAVADYRPGPIQTFADLFCGIGGFHLASKNLGLKCVYACDIDAESRVAYKANFGLLPDGDINRANPAGLPSFDLLMAGFPCQPFSIIGKRNGMSDPRGTLFSEIIRIAKAKRPAAMILENVRQLVTIRNGAVFDRIMSDIQDIGYHVDYKILNALDYGLPQKRERVLIVATRKRFDEFPWPTGKIAMQPLSKLLEEKPGPRYFVSDKIRQSRHTAHQSPHKIGIWHENKGGNVSSHPFSCALRAGASHNYLLVNGERRLTPREMLRLQGFPDSYRIIGNDSQTRKQAGNAVPVPLAHAAIKGILEVYDQKAQVKRKRKTA